MIAVSHPGKLGDSLYALPFCRLLYGMYGEKIDFYTSDYCAPMINLVKFQPYINDVIIPVEYKIERMDMGIQPWYMPIPTNKYSRVYQTGFQQVPDRALHQYIAASQGFDIPLAIRYDYQKMRKVKSKYVCIAPRGLTSYTVLFTELVHELQTHDIRTVVIGGFGDNTLDADVIDYSGTDMLETLNLLAYSLGFVGLMSSQLVLANGFDIPRISPHDGIHWDMRHVVQTPYNHYPINPTKEDILAIFDKYDIL